ncbi:MAG TPA: hypothetical protein PLI01_00325 [Nitrospira sp.]|nr:hypothetical protein [Nitrospira sp.]HNA25204.1 hypothetical protein [Nitrospira sp.]HNI17494.1 hypothetical protein [Nitrospira sp.]
MQIAWRLDKETIKKILIGIGISVGGAVLAGFVVLSKDIGQFILQGTAIDWRSAAFAVWGALSTSIVNTAWQFMKGVSPEVLKNANVNLDNFQGPQA